MQHNFRVFFSTIIFLLLISLIVLISFYICIKKNKNVVSIDYDKNGIIDEYRYSIGKLLIKIELDLNQDGKIDYWQYFENQEQIMALGDKNYDGKLDIWYISDLDGNLLRIEEDVDFDGEVDNVSKDFEKFEFFQ